MMRMLPATAATAVTTTIIKMSRRNSRRNGVAAIDGQSSFRPDQIVSSMPAPARRDTTKDGESRCMQIMQPMQLLRH